MSLLISLANIEICIVVCNRGKGAVAQLRIKNLKFTMLDENLNRFSL